MKKTFFRYAQTRINLLLRQGLLLLPALFCFASTLSAQATWTGSTDSDWYTASNWSPAAVPTATVDVSIPDMANDPVIGAAGAVAKSVTVQSGAVLSIAAAGTLTIDGSSAANNAFLNEGTVENSGTITIGATASVGSRGIRNHATFNNNPGGQITIDRSSSMGLYNFTGSTFTNAATITIGATASVGSYGIRNLATFNNNPGGQITIDRSSFMGLYTGSTFTNAATITIGGSASVGQYGIQNSGTFTNNTGGQITIDRSTTYGIWNEPGTFTNAATITIGAAASGGQNGIHNNGTFNNNTGGQITVDRSTTYGIRNMSACTFTNENAATITIGGSASVGQDGIRNSGTFTNNTGGQITIDRSTSAGLYSSGTFTNTATITVGGSASVGDFGIRNFATFNNNPDGQITIDRSIIAGLVNQNFSTFTNTATITVGGSASVGGVGINNQGTFNNNTGGQITIDRSTWAGLHNSSGTFTNTATITVGGSASVGQYGIDNAAPFNNTACAVIKMFAPLRNTSGFTNAGLFTVITASAHGNLGLTNNGILEYPQGNPISSVTNNDVIARPISGGCTISNALQLGGAVSFTAGTTWYLDQNLSSQAGTYNQATNVFTPTNLPSGVPTTVYLSVLDDVNACSQVVSVKVTFTPPFTFYADSDNDGYGNAAVSILACAAPEGYVSNNTDCNDADASVHTPQLYYVDADDDGYGSTATAMLCSNTAPEGYSTNNTDCNDADASVHPGAQEVCSDGIDNDCNGITDEGCTTVDAGTCQGVYYGYAPMACTTLTAVAANGVPPYTYLWSNGATTAAITVCPTATTVYTVTATDATNSPASDPVTVEVVDVRCGSNMDKVRLCHNGTTTLCIAPANVPDHLAHGDALGDCGAPAPCSGENYGRSGSPSSHASGANSTAVPTLFPNPASGEVWLDLLAFEGSAVAVCLTDMRGALIQEFSTMEAGHEPHRFDLSLLAAGFYFVRIQPQDGKVQTLKLVVDRKE